MDNCASSGAIRATQEKSDTGWNGRPWSDQEIDRLEGFLDRRVTNEELQKAFPGRTPVAVRSRLGILKGTFGTQRQCQMSRDERMAENEALGDGANNRWRRAAEQSNREFLRAIRRAGLMAA